MNMVTKTCCLLVTLAFIGWAHLAQASTDSSFQANPEESGPPQSAAKSAQTDTQQADSEGASRSDDPKAKASRLANEGLEFYGNSQYVEAVKAFEEAHKLFPHYSILYNLAKAYEKAAEYQKAADAFRGYLELHEKMVGEAPGDAKDVESTIALMKEKAYISLPEIKISSDPEGANVFIDDSDQMVGQTPVTIHLAEGNHTVRLEKAGFHTLSQGFTVRSRAPLSMTFSMERIRKEGTLHVKSNIRNARIYVDGKVVAVTPFYEPLVVEAGTHQIIIEKEKYTQFQQTIEVTPEGEYAVDANLYLRKKPFSWRGGLGITSLILGGGAAGAGIWMRSEAAKKFTDSDDFKTYRTWAYVGYGVGAGLAVLGTSLLIWEGVRSAVRPEDRVSDSNRRPVLVGGYDGETAWIGATGTF